MNGEVHESQLKLIRANAKKPGRPPGATRSGFGNIFFAWLASSSNYSSEGSTSAASAAADVADAMSMYFNPFFS